MFIIDDIWAKRRKISEMRLSICNTCEHLDQTKMKCRKCGCFMNYKSQLPYVDCPIGKWGAINIDEVDMSEEK